MGITPKAIREHPPQPVQHRSATVHDPISANTGESRFEAVSSRVSSRCPQANVAADETPLGEGEEGGEEILEVKDARVMRDYRFDFGGL